MSNNAALPSLTKYELILKKSTRALPRNKQTWKKSAQTLLESSWTGNLFIDSVLNQGREEDHHRNRAITPVRWASDPSFKDEDKTIITYSFATKKSKFNYGDDRVKAIKPYASFTKQQKRHISNLFDLIGSYIDVDFKRVKDKKRVGTIRVGFNVITDESGNYLPGIQATADPPNEDPRGGDIWFNKGFIGDNFSQGLVEGFSTPTPSSVMLHEILHSLGLEHPNDNTKLQVPDSVNNWEHTILASGNLEYSHSAEFFTDNKSYGVGSTPMPWDLAALQHLYGANKKTNAGDTTYDFSNTVPFYKTIWDASGDDTLDLTNFTKGLEINLADGELSTLSFDVDDQRWSNKQHGNLGIAFGCIIENATGGTGNDIIIGNSANNSLRGNEGADSLNGGVGLDVLTGGLGQDTFQIQPGIGNAVIMDFTDGEDKILVTDPVAVTARIIGNNIELLSGDDLMATVVDSSGLLQQDGLVFY